MLKVITLLKVKPSPNGEKHGERAFWREHGGRYLEQWIESVDRFIPKPHHIVVLTDVADVLVRQDWPAIVHFRDLDSNVDAPGFWAKLEMFRHGDRGKCLYLDLDNVINGPLDELVALEPDPLIMLDDRRVPDLPNGSAILFYAERCRHIWEHYSHNPRATERNFVARGEDYWTAYDQAFIANRTPTRELFQHLLPDGYILNALTELPTAANPENARLIFGCGADAKPHLSNHPAFSLR